METLRESIRLRKGSAAKQSDAKAAGWKVSKLDLQGVSMSITSESITQRHERGNGNLEEILYELQGFGEHILSVAYMQRQGFMDCVSNNSKVDYSAKANKDCGCYGSFRESGWG